MAVGFVMDQSVRILLDFPCIPAILKIILASPDGVEEEAIPRLLSDRAGIGEATSLLVEKKILVRDKRFLRLGAGDETLHIALRIVEFFEELNLTTSATLMFRGIVTATEYFQCLVHKETVFHLLESEAVPRSRGEEIVNIESELGYVARFFLPYLHLPGLKEQFFPFIPFHHHDDFVSRTGRRNRGEGMIVEEEYLLGTYPAGLADQSRRYLEERRPDIFQDVRNRSFDIIWCYDRY